MWERMKTENCSAVCMRRCVRKVTTRLARSSAICLQRTNHNSARQIIRKIDRDRLLRDIVADYLEQKE